MVNLWSYVSYLGLDKENKSLSNRNIIIANRLNFILIVLMILLNILTTFIRHENHGEYTIHTKKLLILLVICCANLILSNYKKHEITKISLIVFPVLIIVIIPIIFKFIQEDDFIFNPLIVIACSFIPQLIVEPVFSNKLYPASLIFYFLIGFFMDNLLIFFSGQNFGLVDSLQSFDIYYKLVFSSIFIFINFSMHYLRILNYKYENDLNEYNEELLSTVEKLKNTQHQLIQSEKMSSLGTLTGGIAHEMNNPLNFIMGGINNFSDIKEQIKEDVTPEVYENYMLSVNMINTGFERISKTVNALMTFSDADIPLLIDYSVIDLIENTLLFINSRIPSNIEIRKNFEYKGKAPMYPGKMHQVLMNIFDNSLYALSISKQKKKKIIVSTYLEGNQFILSIFNNGPAILEKDLNQIFDPFFTTKDPGKGIGLGLSICYSYVAEHRGKIYAQNLKDGVSFIIELTAIK